MPLTLYRYIFFETTRLLVLSLLVLVGALSFGFTIPAITDGLLTPLQLGRLILYTMPLMLPYATPVAICFSTTLVFFRMASDNEITACIASGMSYRQLLAPVVVIGLVMLISMSIISNWMIPHFSLRVTEIIKQDLVTFVIRQVNKQQAVKMDQWTIYADQATDDLELPEVPKGQPRPYDRIAMYGVAVGQIDRETGLMATEYTAEVAKIDLYHYEGETLANARLERITAVNPESNQLFESAYTNLQGLKLPSPFKMKIQYYSLPRLRALEKNPDSFPDIREKIQRLSSELSKEKARRSITDQVSRQIPYTLNMLTDNMESVEIKGSSHTWQGDRLILSAENGQQVRLRVIKEDQLTDAFDADEVVLSLQRGEFGAEPEFRITMNNVRIYNPDTMAFINEREEINLMNARLPFRIYRPMQEMGSEELTKLSEKMEYRVALRINGEIDAAKTEVRQLINHQIHSRFAMATLGMLACLVSAVVAILLRHSVPLAIFFWCFMPTIATIFAIEGSKNLIRGTNMDNTSAMLVIWLAPAIMLATVILCYMKARKH